MAAYAGTSALQLPRPGRSAAPFAVLCLLALCLEADPRLPWIAGALASVSFAGAAAIRWLRAKHELAAVRRNVDRLIVLEPYSSDRSALAHWRAAEVTAPAFRHNVRREVDRVLSVLVPGSLPGASPLRLPMGRCWSDLIVRLCDRLGEV